MIILNKPNLSVLKVIDKNHPTLGNIAIYKNGSTTGCDGIILAEVSKPSIEIDEYPNNKLKDIQDMHYDDNECITIDHLCAKSLYKNIPNNKILPILNNVIIGEGVDDNLECFLTDLTSKLSIVITKPENKYPGTSEVKPDFKKKPPLFEITFSLDVLSKLIDFVKNAHQLKGNDLDLANVNFKFTGNKTVCGFDAGENSHGQNISGIIMPRKPINIDEDK